MNQMSDVEMSLLNEYRKIDRALEQRKREINELEKRLKANGNLPLDRRPKRYSVEYDFTPGDLQPQEQSFFVDGGSRFYASSIESTFRVTGQAAVDDGGGGTIAGQAVTATLPWSPVRDSTRSSQRNGYFDFLWTIRDTGSDREWQNVPQPALFLLTGALSPLYLPVPGVIRSGSEVFVNIDPFFSRVVNGSNLGLFQTVSTYTVLVSFWGEEVIG
jgi:hypothetical protein